MQGHNCTNSTTHMKRMIVGHYSRLCYIYSNMLAIHCFRKLPSIKDLSITLLRIEGPSHSMCGEKERCLQNFSGEACGKETTWKTQASMGL